MLSGKGKEHFIVPPISLNLDELSFTYTGKYWSVMAASCRDVRGDSPPPMEVSMLLSSLWLDSHTGRLLCSAMVALASGHSHPLRGLPFTLSQTLSLYAMTYFIWILSIETRIMELKDNNQDWYIHRIMYTKYTMDYIYIYSQGLIYT